MRAELMEAWRLREIKDLSLRAHFDSSVTPLWNHEYFDLELQGCNKTLIQKKKVMDLVNWHSPLLMVVMKTKLRGARANEIIELLPFDGAVVTDTISFTRGI